MKIDFSKINDRTVFPDGGVGTRSAADHREAAAGKKITQEGYSLDITGRMSANFATLLYDETGAEKGQAKAMMQGISSLDMSVQHNYFAIMSNSMSAKDFAALRDEGFHPGDMEPEELVTNLDKIKAKLAISGTVIEGYNDSLDGRDLKEIADGSLSIEAEIERALRRNDLPMTGSNLEDVQKALDMTDSLLESGSGELPESSIAYIIDGDLPPTLDNAYQGMQGYPGSMRELSEEEQRQLLPQMEKVIEASGAENPEDAMSDAKWLVERSLPLTLDTLKMLGELKSVSLEMGREELFDKAAQSIATGQRARDLLLIKSEKALTISQLVMTGEANRRLIASDFWIDTTEAEGRLDSLLDEEKRLLQAEGSTLSASLEKTEQIAALPIATVADFIGVREYSLNEFYEKGNIRADAYKRAGESYEALRTEIRPDLGDSIKKAFSNADDILREMELAPSEPNRRAVRILGYNRMEITGENIARVKAADSALTQVMDMLKPGAVMKLIRNGENPLDMSVDELSDKLKQYLDSEDASNEKYAAYLLRLEKNNEISEQEREGYIGIYRLFRQVEKSDGAALGALVDQGAGINIKNLLSAVRSRGASGMDYTVDDDFGGVDSVIPEGIKRIDTQIEQAFSSPDHYRRKNRELLENLDAGKLKQAVALGQLTQQTDIESFSQMMSSEEFSTESGRRAAFLADEEIAAGLREAMDCEETVISALEGMELPVTANNAAAMKNLLYKRGDIYRQLASLGHQLHIAEMIDEFETEDGARAAMEDLISRSEQDVRDAMDDAEMSSVRMYSLMMMGRQLSIVSKMSERENYEVPIEINGEVTSVNLRVIRTGGAGSVRATIHTAQMGALSMSLKMGDKELDGYMLAESPAGEDFLRERLGAFKEALGRLGESLAESFSVMRNPMLDVTGAAGTDTSGDEQDSVNPARLYRMAKAFLEVVGGRYENKQ